MSGTLRSKYYQLEEGTTAHQAVLDWLRLSQDHGMHYAAHPEAQRIVDELGYSSRVTADHPKYGLSYVYPLTRRSPTEGSQDFIMICPIGQNPDRSIGNFIPEGGIELDLGNSALVLHGGEIIFQRTPIKLPPPTIDPSEQTPSP